MFVTKCLTGGRSLGRDQDYTACVGLAVVSHTDMETGACSAEVWEHVWR